ncbi:MAG: manganese-binding transcriptional regulator MntR [Planctomycetes bacterium]|nr:manganese-binding transcriptional regulator MntR [Planctomycetota bacterium]
MTSRTTPFEKVRRDHATETAEDYVEAVADILALHGRCRVKDLADHMGVSHVTVTRIVSRLQGEKLLETAPYRPIRLTPRGESLAQRSRQRHELVLTFLRALGVPEEDAQRDAEGIEHHVGKQTLTRMQHFVEENARPRGRTRP